MHLYTIKGQVVNKSHYYKAKNKYSPIKNAAPRGGIFLSEVTS